MTKRETWLPKFPEKVRLALEKFRGIVCCRDIQSGQPCVSGRRIAVWVLASRYACGESMKYIARDYGIAVGEVREAVRFALWLPTFRDIQFWKLYEKVPNDKA